MIDCNICKHKEDYDYCAECKHGELFERNNVSEPKKISVSNGKEYCRHCGYLCEYDTEYEVIGNIFDNPELLESEE